MKENKRSVVLLVVMIVVVVVVVDYYEVQQRDQDECAVRVNAGGWSSGECGTQILKH